MVLSTLKEESFLKQCRWWPFLHTASQFNSKLRVELISVPRYLYEVTCSMVWPFIVCPPDWELPSEINDHVLCFGHIYLKVRGITPSEKVIYERSMAALPTPKQADDYPVIRVNQSIFILAPTHVGIKNKKQRWKHPACGEAVAPHGVAYMKS